MGKLNDLQNWFKKSDSNSTQIQSQTKSNANQEAEQYQKNIEQEAYLLWEADGKPESLNDHYWKLAEKKIKSKHVPTVYQPYYFIEKKILEPADAWISRQAFFSILGRLGNIAVIAALLSFVFGEQHRRNGEIFAAWSTITTAHGQPGSGGRIEALEFLNSRPLKFPWIGWTSEDWYWDGKECVKNQLLWGLRWKRQDLVGLSTPNEAYLKNIHLCSANLRGADLPKANLKYADLRGANLEDANLQHSYLEGTKFQYANLERSNLQNAYMYRNVIPGSELYAVKFQHANLERSNLQNAYMYRANLQSTLLSRANLQDARLSDANFKDADLHDANLKNAYLGSTNFENTNLWIANLQDARLSDANLENANLVEANLQNTDLEGANFKDADLGGTNLQGALLKNVSNLTFKQIKSACNWDKAIYHGKYSYFEKRGKASEPENTNFIHKLKQDKASKQQEAVDCSHLSRYEQN